MILLQNSVPDCRSKAGAQGMKSGGCQCGAIRFELIGNASKVYACHCGECQKQSASAFGISVIHAPEHLTITQGTPKSWKRETSSGNEMTCWFCEKCGSRLWHTAGSVIFVKGGALDETPEIQTHIWTSRRLPWVVLPEGVETWSEEPDGW